MLLFTVTSLGGEPARRGSSLGYDLLQVQCSSWNLAGLPVGGGQLLEVDGTAVFSRATSASKQHPPHPAGKRVVTRAVT